MNKYIYINNIKNKTIRIDKFLFFFLKKIYLDKKYNIIY